MFAEDIQLNECKPVSRCMGSGEQPSFFQKPDFHYNSGKNSNVLPLLSDPWLIAWNLHHYKGTPNIFSFEEISEVAWEILLFHIKEKQHRASSYNQSKRAISRTTKTRDWQLSSSTVSANPWTHTSPNVILLRKSTLAFFTARLLL